MAGAEAPGDWVTVGHHQAQDEDPGDQGRGAGRGDHRDGAEGGVEGSGVSAQQWSHSQRYQGWQHPPGPGNTLL